jgi:CheY-like chemotaxis protein
LQTILLLEDDEADAFLFKRALDGVAKQRAISINITHKTDGLAGINALKRGEMGPDLPNIIIIDLNMPVVDGMKFLRLLRAEPNYKSLRAVVLTTSTEVTIHSAAISAGADRVFVKPSSIREMVTIAGEILSGWRDAPNPWRPSATETQAGSP